MAIRFASVVGFMWIVSGSIHAAPAASAAFAARYDVMTLSHDELCLHVMRATGKRILWSEGQYVEWLLNNLPDEYYDSSMPDDVQKLY